MVASALIASVVVVISLVLAPIDSKSVEACVVAVTPLVGSVFNKLVMAVKPFCTASIFFVQTRREGS